MCSQRSIEEVFDIVEEFNIPLSDKWKNLFSYLRSINNSTLISDEQKDKILDIVINAVKNKDFSRNEFSRVSKDLELVLFGPRQESIQMVLDQIEILIKKFQFLLKSRCNMMDIPKDTGEEIIREIKENFNLVGQLIREDLEKVISEEFLDDLTGFYNRYFFEKYIKESIYKSHVYSKPLSIIFININDSEKIKESYGSFVFNDMLAATSRLISRELKKNKDFLIYGIKDIFLARVKENVLTIVLKDYKYKAKKIASILRDKIKNYNFVIRDEKDQVVQTEYMITFSIGVLGFSLDFDKDITIEDLLEKGEKSLCIYRETGGEVIGEL